MLALTGADTFYKAWTVDNGSQASITLLWYSNAHHNRVTGLMFLIDYNPPWEGSLKDGTALPNKATQVLEQMVLDIWKSKSVPLEALDAPTIKRKLLVAFKQNQAANIRLPRDVARYRQQFFEHVLTLPDMPDTSAVSRDDFNALSRTGQSPEELSTFERTVGGRMRLLNGEEVFIGPLDQDGFLGWDDSDDLDDVDDLDDLDVIEISDDDNDEDEDDPLKLE